MERGYRLGGARFVEPGPNRVTRDRCRSGILIPDRGFRPQTMPQSVHAACAPPTILRPPHYVPRIIRYPSSGKTRLSPRPRGPLLARTAIPVSDRPGGIAERPVFRPKGTRETSGQSRHPRISSSPHGPGEPVALSRQTAPTSEPASPPYAHSAGRRTGRWPNAS
jgi:hypothetical protein